MAEFTHFNESGRARMVDVTDKAPTDRTATARGHLRCLPETLEAVREGKTPKRKPPPNETTVWMISQEGESMGIHPTQKPLEIFERPISYHTEPGDICLEPFLGSGTQLIAAERLARRCYAIEMEPTYVDVAIERWEAFTGDKAEKVD